MISKYKTFNQTDLQTFVNCLPPKNFGPISLFNNNSNLTTESMGTYVTTPGSIIACKIIAKFYSSGKLERTWSLCYSSVGLICNNTVTVIDSFNLEYN